MSKYKTTTVTYTFNEKYMNELIEYLKLPIWKRLFKKFPKESK